MYSILPLIKKISNHLAAGKNDLLKGFDLTGTQFEILKFLYDRKNIMTSQKDISEFFEIRHTSAIHSLNALESKGFLIKRTNEENAKYKNFYITEKGEETIKTAGQNWQIINSSFVEGLSDKDQEMLYKYLSHCYNNMLSFKENVQEYKL